MTLLSFFASAGLGAAAGIAPQKRKTRRPGAGRRVQIVRSCSFSDHARTQTTSLPGRLTRFRSVVCLVRRII
jgi:hypothetical protein